MAAHGLANNLTEYGDKEFALYLRRSFAKAMGFSNEALDKPIVGILNTYNDGVPRVRTKPSFHPMKGPMSTQSLRGLAGQGPMHWRGDRTGVTAAADETLE
ncbi:MAG: hypothetical protein ACKO4U_11115, partial [Caldilinea sp.]